MGIDDFLSMGQVGLQTAVYVSAPVLMLGLIAGLTISIFQAATQINDPALAFIPKIASAVVAVAVFGHFMVNQLAAFTIWVYSSIATITH